MIIKHDLHNILGNDTWKSLNSPSDDVSNWEVNIAKIRKTQYYSLQLYLTLIEELMNKVDAALYGHLHTSTRCRVK
jgi:hypothetical protein